MARPLRIEYLGAFYLRSRGPFEKGKASTLLDNASFLKGIEKEFLKEKPADRELPALREIAGRPALFFIRKAVEERFAEEPAKARLPLPPAYWVQAEGNRSRVWSDRIRGDTSEQADKPCPR